MTVACTSLWLIALSGTASAAGVSGYHIVSATQNVAAGQGGTASATCPTGDVVLSGGYQVSDSTPGDLNYWGSAPTLADNSLSATTWSAGIGNNTKTTQSVTAYAVCVSSSIAGYSEQSKFFSVPAGSATDGNLACPAGDVVVGGGWLGGPGFVGDSDPSKSSNISTTNWDVFFDGTQSGATRGTVYAICISNSVSGFSDQLNQTFNAGTISQSCPAGQVAIGGGFEGKNPSLAAPVDANGAISTNTWSVTNANPGGGVVGVVTICADALPTVSFLKPSSGAAAGGNTVEVVGNGLSSATKVMFGSVPATRFAVTSDTQISAVAPAGTGAVDVTVVSPGGTSATSANDQYTYLPSVTGISPASGPAAGGTAVTITGVGFTNASAVKFGSSPATQFTTNSDTSISATAPAGADVVDVTVTTPTSTSQASAADRFSYVPSVTGVSPSSGPTGAATVLSGLPTVQSSSQAAFTGSVNPHGLPTVASFQYGLDLSYGAAADGGPTYTNSTASQQEGSGSSPVTISASASGLVPNALYHVRLVATNSAGTTYGSDVTFTTKQDPVPPPPVLGQSFDLQPVSGLVFIRLPGAHAADSRLSPHLGLTKGQGFIPLTEARQLPSGTQIDARSGAIQLISAASQPHKVQTGTFTGGLYGLAQDRRGLTKGLTTLSLLEGLFPGAPSFSSCTAKAADASEPQGFLASVSSKVLQTLHASAHGRFRTRGRYAAATVRGTAWTISDRCNGTLVAVQRHTVAVTDLVRHITVVVRAGHSYLARARRR